MKNADDIERAVRLIRVETTSGADERILAAASAALDKKEKRTVLYLPRLLIRRTVMRNRWTKLTTAAAAALMMAVVANLWQGPAGMAYALEETIDALKDVRSFHIKWFQKDTSATEGRPEAEWKLFTEQWVECDEMSRAERIRAERIEDGALHVYLWEKGIRTDYWPADGKALRKIDVNFAQNWAWKESHPRWVLNDLYEKSREGFWDNDVPDPASVPNNRRAAIYDIEVRGPAEEGEPIIIIRTNTEKYTKDGHNYPRHYAVDPRTKLIRSIENMTAVYASVINLHVYGDYNADFPDEIFRLPRNVNINMTDATRGVGVELPGMSDEEAAREAARLYLEALIERDYTKAALISADPKMAERFYEFYEEMKGAYFVRVKWLDEASPSRPELSPRQYHVKVTYVMRKHNGEEYEVGPPADPNAKSGRMIHKFVWVAAFEKDGKVYWIAGMS